jgi:hypothetical protein
MNAPINSSIASDLRQKTLKAREEYRITRPGQLVAHIIEDAKCRARDRDGEHSYYFDPDPEVCRDAVQLLQNAGFVVRLRSNGFYLVSWFPSEEV